VDPRASLDFGEQDGTPNRSSRSLIAVPSKICNAAILTFMLHAYLGPLITVTFPYFLAFVLNP